MDKPAAGRVRVKMKRRWLILLFVGMGVLLTVSLWVAIWGWGYTTLQLRLAEREGVYSSPRAGMLALIEQNYTDIRKIEITHAGTNSFDGSHPHVGFASAKVWAGARADGSPVGGSRTDYDFPGSYFLHTRKGWVHVPEGAFPELIGFWMEVYDLAGAP